MDRKDFIRKGFVGMGSIVALPSVLASCNSDDDLMNEVVDQSETGDCALAPSETAGPYPIKTPAQLARENIIGDRTGVALLVNLTIQDQSDDCTPLEGVLVDVWHCDAGGNYSQYGSYSANNFLRGRQTTDANGQVSFISIFPGWYPGRAPHIHLKVLNANGNSIRVTQIAFPKDVCDIVYSGDGYNGTADTSNNQDGIFRDSLNGNMLDEITGNVTDGYTLSKVIIV